MSLRARLRLHPPLCVRRLRQGCGSSHGLRNEMTTRGRSCVKGLHTPFLQDRFLAVDGVETSLDHNKHEALKSDLEPLHELSVSRCATRGPWEPAHVNPMVALRTSACNDRWDGPLGRLASICINNVSISVASVTTSGMNASWALCWLPSCL